MQVSQHSDPTRNFNAVAADGPAWQTGGYPGSRCWGGTALHWWDASTNILQLL
jgi:hypothetical protein